MNDIEVKLGDILTNEDIEQLSEQGVRIGPDDHFYTQDFRMTRLNIRYNSEKKVTKIFNG